MVGRDKLEDTELPASAHSSQNSDSEGPTKVATIPRKHRIYTHFPKDRDCDVCAPRNQCSASTQGLRGRKGHGTENIIDAAIADLTFLTTCLVFRRTDAGLQKHLCATCGPTTKSHKALLLPERTSCSCCTPLVPQKPKRNGAHHDRVPSVDVAHGEDCFRPVRWYCYDSVADIG